MRVETNASDAHGADGTVVKTQHGGLFLLPAVEHSVQFVDVAEILTEPLTAIRTSPQTVV